MNKNVLFDTSSGSLNMGDYIIAESVEKVLNKVFKGDFFARYGTHTPVTHFYQNIKRNGAIKYFDSAKYKFVAGTNLLNYNMMLPWNNWNVNIFNYRPYKNLILVGVGMNPNSKKVNWYTKLLYKKVLSKEYVHSTRDERTKVFLESIGLKAINTGCATLWSLDKEKCSKIPTKKSDKVIFTLTDYCRDKQKDQQLIDTLLKNYQKVYFWIQGSSDYDYISSFDNYEKIELVSPNLKSFKEILENGNIDYVGTRLHAGIYAMQHLVRSIIIIVDNRARDMKKNYSIPTLERNNIEKLDELINCEFETDINLDFDKIEEWKNQFCEDKK